MGFSSGYQGKLRRELWDLLLRIARTEIMDPNGPKNRVQHSLRRDLAALAGGKMEPGQASA